MQTTGAWLPVSEPVRRVVSVLCCAVQCGLAPRLFDYLFNRIDEEENSKVGTAHHEEQLHATLCVHGEGCVHCRSPRLVSREGQGHAWMRTLKRNKKRRMLVAVHCSTVMPVGCGSLVRDVLLRCRTYCLPQGRDAVRYCLRCSFLEIYNETISDLLAPSSVNLQIREDGSEKGPFVEGLSQHNVLNSETCSRVGRGERRGRGRVGRRGAAA